MAPGIEYVGKCFEKDVMKRGVPNRDGCSCGTYVYYSGECGCVFKSVFLKCGKNRSGLTGGPVLCDSGRSRIVKVANVLVPFNCKECRDRNYRWAPEEDAHDHQEGNDKQD